MSLNSLLVKHLELDPKKTREENIKDYEQALVNSGYLLRPIMAMINERIQTLEAIKETDFDVPNHYAKYMFKLGKVEGWKELKSILPKKHEA